MSAPGGLFTVDVEEWYQTVLFEPGNVDPAVRTELPRDVDRILDLLDACAARATFFVLGCVAEKYPGLVGAIAARGHEIASHGYSHRRVDALSAADFAAELTRSREVLSRRAGAEVEGFRASTWSLPRDPARGAQAVARAGYRYDSSLYPLHLLPWRARAADDARRPRRLDCGLWEVPPSTSSCLGWDVPFAGGTFLRFQSEASLLRRLGALSRAGREAVLYCHSWEFAASVPRGLPAWKRLLQFGNARGVAAKAAAALRTGRYRPIRERVRELASDAPEAAR